MPINISQESYERVKRSASPTLLPKKTKKMKIENNTDESEENDIHNTLVTSPHRILFSNCSDVESLKKIVRYHTYIPLEKNPT